MFSAHSACLGLFWRLLQKIEAGAMNDDEDAEAADSFIPTAHSDRSTCSMTGSKPDTRSIAVQAGGGVDTPAAACGTAAGGASTAASAADEAAGPGPRSRNATTSSVGFLDDAEAGAAGAGKGATNKSGRSRTAGTVEARRVPANARRAEERRISSSSAGEGNADSTAESGTAGDGHAGKKGSKASKPAATSAVTGGNKARRARASDAGEEQPAAAAKAVASVRSSQVGAAPDVPALPLAATDSSGSFEDTPPSSSRHVRVSGWATHCTHGSVHCTPAAGGFKCECSVTRATSASCFCCCCLCGVCLRVTPYSRMAVWDTYEYISVMI